MQVSHEIKLQLCKDVDVQLRRWSDGDIRSLVGRAGVKLVVARQGWDFKPKRPDVPAHFLVADVAGAFVATARRQGYKDIMPTIITDDGRAPQLYIASENRQTDVDALMPGLVFSVNDLLKGDMKLPLQLPWK